MNFFKTVMRYGIYGFSYLMFSFSSALFAATAGGLDVKPYLVLAKGGYGSGGTFVFNPRTHTWTAISSNGDVIRSGRASGGRSYCPDIGRSCRTPQGVFYVQSKGGAGCRSSRYPVGKGGAKMPYCMFFTSLYAIHGSYEVPNANASHGCIRVTPGDALWLTQNFIRIGTRVVVKPY